MGSQSSKSLPDVILGSPLSHVSSSRDERTQMTDNSSIPYCWTCRLVIETQRGKKYTSNGVKLNLGSSIEDKQVILTTAHSVFIDGSYVRKVVVCFPDGRQVTTSSQEQLWAAPEYVSRYNPKFDYGLILLPGKSNEGFGWTALLTDQELLGRPLSTCGYPSDDPSGCLWITAGGVENVSNHHIHFMQDSLGTGSGSPVYTWYKGYWTIVGIQGFGGVFNTVIRLTPDVMYRIFNVIGYSMSYTIRPHSLPNVYLELNNNTEEDTTLITYSRTSGTRFDIFPIQSEPSSGQWSTIDTPVTIQGLRLYETTKDSRKTSTSQDKEENHLSIHSLYLVHDNSDGSVCFESLLSEGMFLSVSEEEDSLAIKQIFLSKKTKPSPREKFVLSSYEEEKTN